MATFRKRGDKWHVQVRLKGQPSQTRSFRLKSEACAWALQTEAMLSNADVPKTPAMEVTLLQLLERYEQSVSARKRGHKAEVYLLRTLKRHTIALLPAREITSANVAAYRDERLRSVSPSTVRRELALLQHCMNVAKSDWGLSIESNPVLAIKKPKQANARQRRLAGAEELRKLLDAFASCRNPLIRQVFLFALATGMRRGEVLSLQWRNVDLQGRTALLPLTKNGEARVVPLSPSALEVLNERRTLGGDLVFPISANAFRLAWERVRRRAGIENLRFHDLRHEAISKFFEIGLSVPEVALISGHKDARMLFRYTHLRADIVAQKLRAVSKSLTRHRVRVEGE
ncbi:MAG: tyrosine-type recombinase/integrase [Beijerinckiaceae bacterium]